MDSVARGTLINLFTRILGIALGLAIVLATARLGPVPQGTFALFTAVESSLLMLGSGFGVALARRVSQHSQLPVALVGAVIVTTAGIGLGCAAGLLAVAATSDSERSFLWLMAISAPFIFITPSLCGLWLGRARMAALARINLAAPLLTIAGMAIALIAYGGVGLWEVLWSWVVSRILVALGTLLVVWRQGWAARPDMAAMGNEMRFVCVIGLTNLIGLLNYKADLFFVEHFLGRESTGVYSVAVMVAELLWLVSSSVTQAAYSRIGTHDGADASRITLRVVHASLLSLILLAPAVWLAAALTLPRLLGVEYAASLPVLGWLLPGVVAYGAASALSAYFTNHAGQPLIPALLAGTSLVINVILSVLLIPQLGLIGGALATTVSYLVSIAIAAVVFTRRSGTPLPHLLQPDWQALRADLRRLAKPAARA